MLLVEGETIRAGVLLLDGVWCVVAVVIDAVCALELFYSYSCSCSCNLLYHKL